MELIRQGITAENIVTRKSFENAIMVHAAISGSTNATMHLPAIAHEFGYTIDAETFDRMHRNAHYLLNIRPSGDWPAQYFYYAGGVPRVMEEIKEMLHLDVMTVTGKTLGENLEELKQSGFYEHCEELLQQHANLLGRKIERTEIIHDFNHAKGVNGSIAILHGNLAPEGCVIKHTACPKEMFEATLLARPFDSEEECIDAVLKGKIHPGEAVFIRYEGPKGKWSMKCFIQERPFALIRSGFQHCTDIRWTFLGCFQRTCNRACQSGGCGGWTNCACGGWRPHSHQHRTKKNRNCWNSGREKKRRGNRTYFEKKKRKLETKVCKIYQRYYEAIYGTCGISYERCIHGIIKQKKGRYFYGINSIKNLFGSIEDKNQC